MQLVPNGPSHDASLAKMHAGSQDKPNIKIDFFKPIEIHAASLPPPPMPPSPGEGKPPRDKTGPARQPRNH